jgi:hypothetical protein
MKEDLVDDGEDCGIGTDRERQRAHSSHRRRRFSTQDSDAVSEVVQHLVGNPDLTLH